MGYKSIIQIAHLTIIVFLIISIIQLPSRDFSFIETAAAYTTWTQTSETDFKAGNYTNITVTPNGEVELQLINKYVQDEFKDESKISQLINVTVDTQKNESRLTVPDNIFTYIYGGSSDDWGFSAQQTSDGGYVFTGAIYTSTTPKNEICVIKIDNKGKKQWNNTYGSRYHDAGRSIRETSDGGYVITCDKDTYYGFSILKLNRTGGEEWSNGFGGSKSESAYSVLETSDLGYILCGDTGSFGVGEQDVWIVKTNSSGGEEWKKTIGGFSNDWGKCIQHTNDGGYIIAGTTESYGAGESDLWLIKTNSTGSKEWSRTFGGPYWDYGRSVIQTSDGGYIIIGDIEKTRIGYTDIFVTKTNSTGIQEWNQTFDGGFSDEGWSIDQTVDGGYILTGNSYYLNPGGYDVWLIKIDSSGNEQWSRTFGGGGNDGGHYVEQTSDKGFIITGYTESYGSSRSDVWFIKTDENGILNPVGELCSKNLMSGDYAKSIDTFKCRAKIPSYTKIEVQFSKDGIKWYDKYGFLNDSTSLNNGLNSMDISDFNWKGSSFYYRAKLYSERSWDDNFLPSIQIINLSFSKYSLSGFLESKEFDAGDSVSWKTLSWLSDEPGDTELQFQLRTANTKSELWPKPFIGPDGTRYTYYTTSGESIWLGHNYDRWIQFKAYLSTINNTKIPVLKLVNITLNQLPKPPTLIAPIAENWVNISKPEFIWSFIDKDSNSQVSFQLQVDNNDDFKSIEYDSKITTSSTSRYKPTAAMSDGIWYWHVRTKDSDGNWGPYSQVSTLKLDTTIAHPIDITINEKLGKESTWTSLYPIAINWTNPQDLSGIKAGAYYYMGSSFPKSQSVGTWVANKPFYITDIPPGSSNIYIWLEDNAGNRNYLNYNVTTIRVDVNTPQILHSTLKETVEYENIEFSAIVTDDYSGVDKVTLCYKKVSESNYTKLDMIKKGEEYTIVIPGACVTSEDIEYYLEATDKTDHPNRIYYGKNGMTTLEPTEMSDIDIKVKRSPKIRFEVIDYSPKGVNIPVETTIIVNFNKSIDEASVKNAFSISPYVMGVFSFNETKLVMIPNEPLKYNTTYSITISKAAIDLEGYNLISDVNWSFTTKPLEKPPPVDGGDGSEPIEPDGDKPKSTEKGDNTLIIGITVVVIVVVIVFIVIVLLLFLKKKKPGPPSTRESSNQGIGTESVIQPTSTQETSNDPPFKYKRAPPILTSKPTTLTIPTSSTYPTTLMPGIQQVSPPMTCPHCGVVITNQNKCMNCGWFKY